MEMIKISRDKLKVMMTSSDMEKYELEIDKMSYDDINTRSSIGKILEKAKTVCGFCSISEKMLIQVFPSRGGGCEIFVTALDIGNETEATEKSNVFLFRSMSELIECCYEMSKADYFGESSAYSVEKSDICYLVCFGKCPEMVNEYADKYSVNQFMIKCREHLVPIIENNAVHMLAGYYVR